jgi:signal transduction histidine kinase
MSGSSNVPRTLTVHGAVQFPSSSPGGAEFDYPASSIQASLAATDVVATGVRTGRSRMSATASVVTGSPRRTCKSEPMRWNTCTRTTSRPFKDLSEASCMRRQLRQLAARVESAREEERARISRDVHDQFGQMLSALKLDFETLASQFRPRGAEARSEFDQRVAAIIRGIDLSMKTVRRITAEMRPAVFENLGLAAALDWQLQEFESRTGIRCRRRGLARNAGLAAKPSLPSSASSRRSLPTSFVTRMQPPCK